ncbi:site-specific DNA-methyltransferase, partial [Candidatus Poribacteria bacterium]|nr:site-specific DNA-methyltransferase [Candidatus Poribacteria bacterium]
MAEVAPQYDIFDGDAAAVDSARVNGRRVQGGVATTDVILSAHSGSNADVFPQVLELHVPAGSVVADVTYGTGIFWRKIPAARYKLRASDIDTGVDCRTLPYVTGSIDCVVLDPPYMEGLFRKSADHLAGSGTHSAFREKYSNGEATTTGPKWHEAVLDLYFSAGKEALRVLKEGGVF